MNSVEKIRAICKTKRIPISKLERDCGFANGYIAQLRKGTLPAERLSRVAAYFGVEVSALLSDKDPEDSVKVVYVGENDASSSRFYRLNEQGQLMALDYMDFLLTRYAAFPEETEDNVLDLGEIRWYLHAPAAGYSAPVLDEDYIDISRTEDMPKNADYCLNVRGDSMEPYIHDGQRVFVRRTSSMLEDGEVGVWAWQGETFVKQVAEDAFGNIHLLSANPKREDANIFVRRADIDQLTCLGKVLLPKRLPMPHYD